MKQDFPSATELKAAFNQQKESRHAWFAETGIITAIEALSKAVRDLRDIGVNVQLQLNGNASEDAFSLTKTVTEIKGGLTVPVSGILKIDQVEHLLALSVKEGEAAVLKIYVSDFDYRGLGATNSIRGQCFDLGADAQAVRKLQEKILFTAVRNEIIRDHDVGNSLGFDEHRNSRLPKSKL
ncbi:MAG: hypothetical protein K8R48_03490 [Alphaproteobacteria bacterium]|nr:hypothetical protein [Alphaproteobacteria bacterium]